MTTERNPFLDRVLQRSQRLLLRADLAVEGARYQRMRRFRRRSGSESRFPDEAAEARLRRDLGSPAGGSRSAPGSRSPRPDSPPRPTLRR